MGGSVQSNECGILETIPYSRLTHRQQWFCCYGAVKLRVTLTVVVFTEEEI